MEEVTNLVLESSTTGSDLDSMETSSSADKEEENNNNNNSDKEDSNDDDYSVGDKSQESTLTSVLSMSEFDKLEDGKDKGEEWQIKTSQRNKNKNKKVNFKIKVTKTKTWTIALIRLMMKGRTII